MLVGLEKLPEEAKGTIPWQYGWQKEKVDFGSDKDYLAAWLDQVTAIINVPTLMDDNILGLRCAMANLSFPLVKSPGRLYQHMRMDLKNCGDPFVPEIYNLPQIKGKVRLHIANGLRILYYGGPVVRQTYVREASTLIFSTAPVALDRRGLELLRSSRREMVMPSGVSATLNAPYLLTAQAMGLGYQDLNFIEYLRVPSDKKKKKPVSQTP